MFGKYEVSLTEATRIKNFLLKNEYTTCQAPFFGTLIQKDTEKELALDFSKTNEDTIQIPHASGTSNIQRNVSTFRRAHLKVHFDKGRLINVILTVKYVFYVVEHGPGVHREGTLTYHAKIPINDFFKI